MNRRGFQDDAPPWSFFLPVTLAVVLGILIADAVRLVIGTVFERETVEVRAPEAAAETAASGEAPTAEPDAAPGSDTPAAAPSASAKSPAPQAAADDEVPEWPGPISAMRDGGERACINGTVAERRPNGWEQALEDDAPVRCTATSP